MPLIQCNRLYIHSSFRSIAKDALNKVDPSRRKYVVVTGTPGTGKSAFIYYVMWRLIKDKKRVLFFSHDGPIYFDGSKILECHTLPNKFDRQFWSADLWCLVDAMDPTTIGELPHGRRSVLLVSTPQRDCIGDFKKLVPVPEVFYRPLWTKEELAAIADMYPDAASVWEERFMCLGGIPRLVLQDIATDPQALLMSACNSCSLDDTIMMVSINSEINPNAKVIQRLVHMQSEAPYREYTVTYASELAKAVIARTKWQSDRRKMQSLLGSCDGNPLAQSLCGYIFEPYAMDLLEQGGIFVSESESGKQGAANKPMM